MPQNIYDNPEFFAGYSNLPRQTQGLDGAPEWPAIRAMLPDPTGAIVADLGCGFGWTARWFRENGAASVLGLDLSQNMIARAQTDTNDPAIEYRIANLETVELTPDTFDLVYSALTFHYIQDFARLMRMIRTGLKPGSNLVFSIEHPIFMAAADPRWIQDGEGRKTWPVNGYANEGERRTDWFASGVIKYHRTLATTLNTLTETGFSLRRLTEFSPSPEQIAAVPGLAEERERPMMLIVSASKN